MSDDVRARSLLVAVLLVIAAGVSLGASTPPRAKTAPPPPFQVLVFTKTEGFRHGSIPAAVRMLRGLGARGGFTVTATEDAAVFADARLARYRVVVFCLTTGDILDPGQQTALRRYVRRGNGFVGIHSAADTEHGWPWYGRLLGARFASHPDVQRASIDVVDRRHPSTAHLPARWEREDEWYNLDRSPRGSARILATLDETSYAAGEQGMGADHPIAWSHSPEGGRSWYTGGGHTPESYGEPLFRQHVLGGIRWAARRSP